MLWSGDLTLNYNAEAPLSVCSHVLLSEAVYYDAATANHLEAVMRHPICIRPGLRTVLPGGSGLPTRPAACHAAVRRLQVAQRMAGELYPTCLDAVAFPAPRRSALGRARQAHMLPSGVQLQGVGRGDLGQKQIGRSFFQSAGAFKGLFVTVPFILPLGSCGRPFSGADS